MHRQCHSFIPLRVFGDIYAPRNVRHCRPLPQTFGAS